MTWSLYIKNYFYSMNRYEIKINDKEWTYMTTINPNLVMNEISFTENVNGWQWQLKLDLALSFWDTTFQGGEIVKIILYNERYKQGKLIYSWYVSQISRIYDVNKWYIEITCLWIASLLNSILFSWVYSWTVETILTTIISKFNQNYWWNLISIWQIDSYSENISVEFSNDVNCSKAIDEINNIVNYYRFIDSEWKFFFRKKFTQKNHIVANKQNVESMNLNYNIESIINKLYVERKNGVSKLYENTTSQELFWIKEMYNQQSSIANERTQDEFWTNYLNQYSTPKNANTIVINDKYEIESFVPWDTITVVNTEYSVKNLLIEKISFTWSKVKLTLEENESLRGVISS